MSGNEETRALPGCFHVECVGFGRAVSRAQRLWTSANWLEEHCQPPSRPPACAAMRKSVVGGAQVKDSHKTSSGASPELGGSGVGRHHQHPPKSQREDHKVLKQSRSTSVFRGQPGLESYNLWGSKWGAVSDLCIQVNSAPKACLE